MLDLNYLPCDRQIAFYEGCYYSLNELLKRIPILHVTTRDIIKIQLFEVKLKLMQIQSKQIPS